MRLLLAALLLAALPCFAGVPDFDPMLTPPAAHSERGASSEPVLAGALGIMPFVSGLYLGPQPAQGIVFTLGDGALALAIWSARNTRSGDPDNTPWFYLAMGAANALDAVISVRTILRTQKLSVNPVTLDPSGRVTSSLTMRF